MASSSPLFNVGGLASGLDTNSIVDQLMAIERQPQTRLLQRQRVEEARQNGLRDVSTRLANLKSAAAALRDSTLWADVQTVESSDASRATATRTSGAAAGAYDLTITQLARAQQLTQGSAVTAAAAGDTLHLQVGSGTTVNVAITAGDSLETIASKINSTTDTQVYASVVNSKLVLTGKVTGASSTISATSDGSLAADLGLAETLAPLDAQYTVDGAAKTSASNTVTNAINGVTLTLKAKTTSAVTITVGAPGPDSAAIQDKVKAFVDQYNSTIDFIRGKLSEQKVRDPKTDDDRAKGVLANDSGLSLVLSRLRNAVADLVGGRPTDLDQLAEAGITTGASTGSATPSADAIAGKLTLDSTKLATALSTRFSDVKALFNNATGDPATEGFAQRVDRLINPYTSSGGILPGRIASEQSIIDDLKHRRTDLEYRLGIREKHLRSQFTAMETALSQSQSQSQWLSGQIARLSQ